MLIFLLVVAPAATRVAATRPMGAPIDANGTGAGVFVLSDEPRIYYLRGLATRDEVERSFIRLAKPSMKQSGLSYGKDEVEGQRESDKERGVRSSQGAWVTRTMDHEGIVDRIEQKIAILTGVHTDNGESWNVLKYEHNQHYAHHFDYFDPISFPEVAKNNRIATVLLYLHKPDKGGHTIFPNAGPTGYRATGHFINEYDSCDHGLKFVAEPGDGILFFSQDPGLIVDEMSLHGGCPVENGTKWGE